MLQENLASFLQPPKTMLFQRLGSRYQSLWTALALLAVGCGAPDDVEGQPQGKPEVDVGLAGGDGSLEFLALAPGAEVPLETFGQGGRHVLLAVRTYGQGPRVYIRAALINSATGAQASTPFGARPSLLRCDENGNCDLAPFVLPVGAAAYDGLTSQGLPVQLRVDTETPEGLSASVIRDVLLTLP